MIASSLAAQLGYAGAVQQKPPRKRSMKGWELHSWTERGAWRFTLLVGTNRSKQTLEIKAPAVALPNVATLKEKLGELASGQSVFWETMIGFDLPPAAITEPLRQHCQTLGLRLEIYPLR
jgi:hypothetical protein